MAVCNRFTQLENPTGNFLMFSNYTEDICKYSVFDSNYRVVPSKFYVLNADFANFASDRNTTVPKLFQNRFENWVAAKKNEQITYDIFNETNAFWGFISSMGLLPTKIENNHMYFNTIKYIGDISLESYDLHNDMGYAEIICHIPSEATIKKYYSDNWNISSEEPEYLGEIGSNNNYYCWGWTNDENAMLDGSDFNYHYLNNQDLTKGPEFSSEDDKDTTTYSFNMVIVCYDIYENGSLKYEGRPMGVYFPGIFDESGNMTNTKNIYVANADAFGASTTYALRICTRFTPNSLNESKDTIITSQEDYANMGYVLSKLADSIDTMNEISKNFAQYKKDIADVLAQIKNNRTNVPYIVDDHGTQYWCVNGRKVVEIPMANIEEVSKVLDDNFSKENLEIIPKGN